MYGVVGYNDSSEVTLHSEFGKLVYRSEMTLLTPTATPLVYAGKYSNKTAEELKCGTILTYGLDLLTAYDNVVPFVVPNNDITFTIMDIVKPVDSTLWLVHVLVDKFYSNNPPEVHLFSNVVESDKSEYGMSVYSNEGKITFTGDHTYLQPFRVDICKTPEGGSSLFDAVIPTKVRRYAAPEGNIPSKLGYYVLSHAYGGNSVSTDVTRTVKCGEVSTLLGHVNKHQKVRTQTEVWGSYRAAITGFKLQHRIVRTSETTRKEVINSVGIQVSMLGDSCGSYKAVSKGHCSTDGVLGGVLGVAKGILKLNLGDVMEGLSLSLIRAFDTFGFSFEDGLSSIHMPTIPTYTTPTIVDDSEFVVISTDMSKYL